MEKIEITTDLTGYPVVTNVLPEGEIKKILTGWVERGSFFEEMFYYLDEERYDIKDIFKPSKVYTAEVKMERDEDYTEDVDMFLYNLKEKE